MALEFDGMSPYKVEALSSRHPIVLSNTRSNLNTMLNFVQTRIKYTFTNEQLLCSALKSAHRERDDGMVDDGNRGLAHYGLLAIQMTETHNVIVEEKKTLRKLDLVCE